MTPVLTDYSQYRFYFDIAQFALTGAIGVYFWLSNRGRINRKRFVDLEKDVGQKISDGDVKKMFQKRLADCSRHQAQTKVLEQTATRMEAKIQSVPSWGELKSLNCSISSLSTRIAKLDGKFVGLDRVVDMINEFMINKGGRQ